jgi:hypothetical protein
MWLALFVVSLLSACGLIREWTDPTTVSVRGVPPTLEQLNVGATIDAQNQLLGTLMVTAGLEPGAERTAEDWDLVFRAGVYEIGRQCDQYLDVLFRFNREQRAGRQDLAAAAAAAGAIMGLTGVSSKAIGITAAAFGLASSWFDASVNSVLFTIEPSALRNVALQGRQKYLDDLKQKNVKINSRPDMLIASQGYLTQCSPAALEANINNAAAGSPFAVTYPDVEKAKEAAALAAPGTVLLQSRTGPIDLQGTGAGAGSGASAPAIAAEVARILEEQKITKPRAPLQNPITVPQKPEGCVTPAECALSDARVRQYQTALCVVPPTGAFDTATRTAIHDFLVGRTRPENPAATTNKIDDRTKTFLDQVRNLNCATAGFQNAFEVGWLGVPRTMENLRSNLEKLLKKSLPPAKAGEFDQSTRDAIAEICGKGEIDFECRTKIVESVNKLILERATPSAPR